MVFSGVFLPHKILSFYLPVIFQSLAWTALGHLIKKIQQKHLYSHKTQRIQKNFLYSPKAFPIQKKILYSPKRFQKYLLEQKSQKRILTFTQKKSYLWKEKVFLPVLMKKTAANQNKIISPSLHLLSGFIFPYFTILFYIIS